MTDRDREIERLTEVFKDAILHAPIPDVNPNLIRTVESQARECALRVGRIKADVLREAAQESWVRGDIGKPEGGTEAWDWLRARADQIENGVSSW